MVPCVLLHPFQQSFSSLSQTASWNSVHPGHGSNMISRFNAAPAMTPLIAGDQVLNDMYSIRHWNICKIRI